MHVINSCHSSQRNSLLQNKNKEMAASAETACGNGHSCMVNNTSAMNKISRLVSKKQNQRTIKK